MYVIVGANGFLGAYVINEILRGTDENILAVDLNIDDCIMDSRVQWQICDVTLRDDVDRVADIIAQSEPCRIIYLAAYHHPDKVEKNFSIAWNINITALSYFLNRIGPVASFVYPSTDTVYGNGTMEYRFSESDAPAPENCYGIQKSVAEKLVTGYGYKVVRFPFLIGPSLLKHKQHFYDVIAETIASGKPMEMFEDSYRSSLDFKTVAELLIELTQKQMKDIPAVLNVSGDDALSKYDVGIMIADKLGVDKSLIVPISCEEINNIFEAKRASVTLMDNGLLKRTLGLSTVIICV